MREPSPENSNEFDSLIVELSSSREIRNSASRIVHFALTRKDFYPYYEMVEKLKNLMSERLADKNFREENKDGWDELKAEFIELMRFLDGIKYGLMLAMRRVAGTEKLE